MIDVARNHDRTYPAGIEVTTRADAKILRKALAILAMTDVRETVFTEDPKVNMETDLPLLLTYSQAVTQLIGDQVNGSVAPSLLPKHAQRYSMTIQKDPIQPLSATILSVPPPGDHEKNRGRALIHAAVEVVNEHKARQVNIAVPICREAGSMFALHDPRPYAEAPLNYSEPEASAA